MNEKDKLRQAVKEAHYEATFWLFIICLMFVPAVVGASFILRLLTCAWLGWCFTWGC